MIAEFKDAIAYLETDEVMFKREKGNGVLCARNMFDILEDDEAESYHDGSGTCTCHSFPVYALESIEWTEEHERNWLDHKSLPTLSKEKVELHYQWIRQHEYKNELM